MKPFLRGNVLLNKGYKSHFFAVLMSCFLWSISSLVDSAMAGVLFSLEALTGISIALIFDTMVFFLYSAFVSGGTICIGNEMGKGQNEEANIYLSQNIYFLMTLSLLIFITGFFGADWLVVIMGAHDPEIARYAAEYLKVLAISYLFFPITEMMYYTMLLYGYKKEINIELIIELVVNLVSSLFYVKVLKTGVGGLALGTCTAYFVESVYLIISVIVKPRGMRFIPRSFKNIISNEWNVIKKGLPSCINTLSDFFQDIIMTNMIALTLGKRALTVYALFLSMHFLALNVPDAAGISMSGFSSVFFGARDVSGLKKIQQNAFKIPTIVGVIISGIVLIFYKQVLMLFGADDPEITKIMFGAFLWLIPLQLLQIVQYNLVSYYSVTRRPVISAIYSIAADFILYIPVTFLLMKKFKVSAIWISYNICFILLFAIMFVIYHIYYRKKHADIRKTALTDKYMLLPADFFDDKNLLVFSLSAEKDHSLDMMKDVQLFLAEQGFGDKIAMHCTLCLEELAARILMNHPNQLDIRIFVSNGKLKFSIKDDGPSNNHLAFEPVDFADGVGIQIVRKMAETVEYSYMLDFNMLNVTIQ